MGAYWSAVMGKRNPSEAEEDDISPLTDDMHYLQRRKSLTKELRRYYSEAVAIPNAKRKRAKEVVEDIKRSLQWFVGLMPINESESKYIFGNIISQGSSYEGLKVIEPNEFDLLLPLELEDGLWTYTAETAEEHNDDAIVAQTQYFYIEKDENAKTLYENAIFNCVYLDPITIKQRMQSIVQRAINKMNFPYLQGDITLCHGLGPALTLGVCYDDDKQKMKIDIVPSIRIDDNLFVAKKHPDADYKSPENMHNYLWRESYSEKEKKIIKKMDKEDECRRTCLKILKTIREKKEKKASLLEEALDSYHLKTCMLHLNDDKTIGPWDKDKLKYRFKDLLRKLLEFLEKKTMPNYHCSGVNLLSTIKNSQRIGIINWLTSILDSDDEHIINEMLS
ncbi:cyclic GMP-AMP synthase-like [Anneissia japonica]|uniref:cyclic GMP-AMP synthase-like n=1 Tax=Anneissia japonica TaxID=1529436 RepID=UPI001425B3C5|nr:cyclic GMP-AMP synthase-like [Anneissia japonica]XP_033120702.1 cyclic GMP-AMP synthase-like [Anneissia japonica]